MRFQPDAGNEKYLSRNKTLQADQGKRLKAKGIR
jgi:hypothetical protein